METLENKLEDTLIESDINVNDINSIKNKLFLLYEKHPDHYDHSIRTGILAINIAKYMGLDPKPMAIAGFLHDIGKIMIPKKTLDKKYEPLNNFDWDIIKKHPLFGYYFLKERHDFASEIVLRHHYYQKNSYPENLPVTDVFFSEDSWNKIEIYSKILALADFYDSGLTRDNSKFGKNRKLSPEECTIELMKIYSEHENLILELYDNFIIGDAIDSKRGKICLNVPKQMNKKREVSDIIKNLTFFSSLDPYTRNYNGDFISYHVNFEYIFSDNSKLFNEFKNMGESLLNNIKPISIFSILRNVKNNYLGNHRINLNVVETIIPIFFCEYLFDKDYNLSYNQILDKSYKILHNTNKLDVLEILRSKHSNFEGQIHSNFNNVYDFYESEIKYEKEPSKLKLLNEILTSYPTIRNMYKQISKSKETEFNKTLHTIFLNYRKNEHSNYSHNLTADLLSVATYLYISRHHKRIILD